MTTQQSDPRGPTRPTQAPRPFQPDRASYPTSGYPRARAVVWTVAALCGGLVILMLLLTVMGAVDFAEAPAAGIATIAMAVFFMVVMGNYARSSRRGNSRWSDRERRGF